MAPVALEGAHDVVEVLLVRGHQADLVRHRGDEVVVGILVDVGLELGQGGEHGGAVLVLLQGQGVKLGVDHIELLVDLSRAEALFAPAHQVQQPAQAFVLGEAERAQPELLQQFRRHRPPLALGLHLDVRLHRLLDRLLVGAAQVGSPELTRSAAAARIWSREVPDAK